MQEDSLDLYRGESWKIEDFLFLILLVTPEISKKRIFKWFTQCVILHPRNIIQSLPVHHFNIYVFHSPRRRVDNPH